MFCKEEKVMSKSKRVRISRRRSRREFRRGLKTETRNLVMPPQRGGYRM